MPRVAAPKTATNFLNSKKRVIYVSSTGKYYVTGAAGKPQYGVKAKFVKNGNSNKSLANLSGNVPNAIRPATGRTRSIGPRRQRKNAGTVRGPRPVSNAAALRALFAEPKGYSRRPRSNKGVARGPRALPPLTANVPLNYGAGMGRLFRAKRKNAGVKRGPRHFPRNVTVLTV